MANETIRLVGVAVLVVAGTLTFGWLADRDGAMPNLRAVAAAAFLPRSDGAMPFAEVWFVPFVVSCYPGVVPRLLRQLRTLPLATVHIVALVMVRPLVWWLVWSGVVAGTTMAFGLPVAWPTHDALLSLVGLSALAHAYQLPSAHGRTAGSLVVLIGLLLFPTFLWRWVGPVLSWTIDLAAALSLTLPAVIGIAALAAAAMMNYRTIARRSATYRPAAAGFGVPVSPR